MPPADADADVDAGDEKGGSGSAESAEAAKKAARKDAKRSGKRVYECVCDGGAVIRAGPAMDSPKVAVLGEGDFIVSLEEAILMSNSTRRVKFHHQKLSIRGWLSVTAGDGSKSECC